MIVSKAYDIEVLPNFFSITIVDVRDYLAIFKDCCDDKGRPIPLVQKISVTEIKERLAKVKTESYYITSEDDSQLFSMIAAINNMRYHTLESGEGVRHDMFGYNSSKYDKLMIAAFLMNATNIPTTKELITKLYNTSKHIINIQDDRDVVYKDPYLNQLRGYGLPYVDIDVMSVFALNKVGSYNNDKGEKVYYGKGLKQTSINLQWYELLEYELPPIGDDDIHLYQSDNRYKGMSAKQINTLIDKWDRFIIDKWIEPMMIYNVNDVHIVCELIRLNMDEILSRYAISNSYKVNVLNSSRSDTADVLFDKFYSDFSGLAPRQWKGKSTERTHMAFKKVIFPFIEFKTEPLKELLRDMKKVVITSIGKGSFSRDIVIGNVDYTVATGGLHSKDIPRELKSNMIDKSSSTGKMIQSVPKGTDVWDLITDDSYIYVLYDVASFYPFIMAMHNVAPAHLNEEIFVRLVKWLAQSRVDAKHTDEKYIEGVEKDLFVTVLKIVINSIYGKLGYQYGDLYDRLAVLKVTINGQLMLLMLCEELELNGIEVASGNTDGILVKLYKRDKEKFDKITAEWRKKTKLQADVDLFSTYVNRDINNYFAQEVNGKMEYKGALNPYMYLVDLSKGYDMPIVAKAVVEYFANDVPIMETLYNATNILDFCKTQNVGKQYHVGYLPSSPDDPIIEGLIPDNNGNYEIQRQVRFYVSTNGGEIKKIHNVTGGTSRLAAGEKVTILNSMDDKDIALRNISYTYYFNECNKIIDPIKLNISPTSKGNPITGTKGGKALIKKYSGMYNSLFDDDDFE